MLYEYIFIIPYPIYESPHFHRFIFTLFFFAMKCVVIAVSAIESIQLEI